MATYYRWDKSTAKYTESIGTLSSVTITPETESRLYYSTSVFFNPDTAIFTTGAYYTFNFSETKEKTGPIYVGAGPKNSIIYGVETNGQTLIMRSSYSGTSIALSVDSGQMLVYSSKLGAKGSFLNYVYSTSSSAYPTDGVSGSYYYDNRTTVTSPTNPSGITYSQQISSLLIPISWSASISNVSDYPVKNYEVSYCLNNTSSWQVAGTTTQTTYSFGLSDPSVTQIQFRVRAMDTNSQYSDYVTGSVATVQYVPANPPVLTLPQNVKLGTTIAISWNSVQDATNYIVQRKTMDKEEWTQIYSGSNLSCSNLIDALGISYRICFNVGSNYTSPWSDEYRLSTYEKIIEMTYLGSDGQYMPLYPRTITNAVVNASDLIQTTMLTGKYTGNGMESNEVLLANNIEPKVGFLYDSSGNVTGSVGFNDEGNLVVDKNLGFNESGSEYGYVVIGEKSNNDFE